MTCMSLVSMEEKLCSEERGLGWMRALDGV
jgi:hypothetical protein